AIDRDIAGRDHHLSGRLRVTSSETLAYRKLTGHLARFRQTHPGIVVELVVDNRVLNLARREADIALRPMRPKEGDLWGRKLADVAWTIYGAVAYLEERAGAISSADDLGRHALIGWEETAGGIMAADWLNRTVSDGASFTGPTASSISSPPRKPASVSRCFPAISATKTPISPARCRVRCRIWPVNYGS